eukprot:1360834-Amorphochlora_amoeboformis.AAC.1
MEQVDCRSIVGIRELEFVAGCVCNLLKCREKPLSPKKGVFWFRNAFFARRSLPYAFVIWG